MIEDDSTRTGTTTFIQGTCGWSDQSLVSCGRFYPKGIRSSTEKLHFYSRSNVFGCVEVDSSSYHIPTAVTVSKWLESTPAHFKFHFKAFGFLVHGGGKISSLPQHIRSMIDVKSSANNSYLSISKISEQCSTAIWQDFNSALLPARTAGKLGVVVFQFQLNIIPTESARNYIEYCAKNLDPTYPMGVEFRNRKWFEGENAVANLQSWLGGLRGPNMVTLISCDDLEHELYQRDSEQCGLTPGRELVHLPIHFSSNPFCNFLYVRVHRRFGTNRVLADWEIDAWRQRIMDVAEKSNCTIYFLWGTDHEDQPIINARNLSRSLPPRLLPSLKERQLTPSRKTDGIAAAFARSSGNGKRPISIDCDQQQHKAAKVELLEDSQTNDTTVETSGQAIQSIKKGSLLRYFQPTAKENTS